jgi:hypothetical protein
MTGLTPRRSRTGGFAEPSHLSRRTLVWVGQVQTAADLRNSSLKRGWDGTLRGVPAGLTSRTQAT